MTAEMRKIIPMLPEIQSRYEFLCQIERKTNIEFRINEYYTLSPINLICKYFDIDYCKLSDKEIIELFNL